MSAIRCVGMRLLTAALLLLLWSEKAAEVRAEELPEFNVPPPGFTALFNGKDFTGWRAHPKVREMWSIEDGVLKSHGLLEEWGADLVTEKEYLKGKRIFESVVYQLYYMFKNLALQLQ